MPDLVAKYRKFIVALVGVAVSVLTYYFADASWVPFVIQALAAVGVYAVPNDHGPRPGPRQEGA